MSRLIPSTSSLKVFESSARHLSFSKAADELNLTQSAVSRHIKGLEDLLGMKLFYRVRKRVVLSDAGAKYAASVRECLGKIEEATLEVLAHKNASGVLRLAILPLFGTKWLIPRMPAFWKAHPEIAVEMKRPPLPFDFSNGQFDAAILFRNTAALPRVIAHRLISEDFMVVCSPALLKQPGLAEINDLSRHTLLQHATLPHAWHDWLEAAGAPHINGLQGPRFERFSLVLTAAIANAGVALLPRFVVQDAVASGQLVVCFDISLPETYVYYFMYPEEKKDLPALRIFREWLQAEAENTFADPFAKEKDPARPTTNVQTANLLP